MLLLNVLVRLNNWIISNCFSKTCWGNWSASQLSWHQAPVWGLKWWYNIRKTSSQPFVWVSVLFSLQFLNICQSPFIKLLSTVLSCTYRISTIVFFLSWCNLAPCANSLCVLSGAALRCVSTLRAEGTARPWFVSSTRSTGTWRWSVTSITWAADTSRSVLTALCVASLRCCWWLNPIPPPHPLCLLRCTRPQERNSSRSLEVRFQSFYPPPLSPLFTPTWVEGSW